MDFAQVSVLFVVATFFGVAAKLLKQPLLVGYILAGIAASSLGVVKDGESLNVLGQIGVAFLLFLLGLEMRLGDVSKIGKTAIYTGAGQIIFTSIVGFLILIMMGVSAVPALYIAVALCFSSTIIMVKLLGEKKDLGSLYGKISIGFLLFQDIVAILILIFLSGLSGNGSASVFSFVLLLLKTLLLILFTWVLSKKVLPFIFEKVVSSSMELLFISSISWALGYSSFVAGPLGLSVEIGGFLAGIALSNLPEHLQIASRARPLRDFFLTLFFLYLGSKLAVSGDFGYLVIPALILSVFVLVGNPLIVAGILGYLGHKKRTSFLAGLTVAQISEFSLVLMTLGERLGHVEERHVSLVILVGIVTMTASTYLIMGSERIFEKIKNRLNFLERKNVKEKAMNKTTERKDHIVLVGCDRTGRQLVEYLEAEKYNYLVVDFNPDVVGELTAKNIEVIFGDITDLDVLESAGVTNARAVISTIGTNDNHIILDYISSIPNKPQTIFTSASSGDAIELYEKGASFVVVPETVAGEYIKHLISVYGFDEDRIRKSGRNQFNKLISLRRYK
jgi:Kef-type K+ transport system membrane component KefB